MNFKTNPNLKVGQLVQLSTPFFGTHKGTVVAVAPEERPSDGFRYAGAEFGVLIDIPNIGDEVWALQEDVKIIE